MKKKSNSKPSKPTSKLANLEKSPILKPLSVQDVGSNNDPCFGKGYDLTTKECKMCGDSELCAIVFAQTMNKSRSKIEEEQHFKDMDILIDIPSVKKFMRGLKRSGSVKKDILEKAQVKFKIAREDARSIYRSIVTKTQ
jgi:hypothetical protein